MSASNHDGQANEMKGIFIIQLPKPIIPGEMYSVYSASMSQRTSRSFLLSSSMLSELCNSDTDALSERMKRGQVINSERDNLGTDRQGLTLFKRLCSSGRLK